MIRTYGKGVDLWVGQQWRAREFDCHCPRCSITLIDSDLVRMLDILVLLLGGKPRLNSAYRCDAHQAELTEAGKAKGRSMHQDGKAIDLEFGGLSGLRLEELARKAGFKAVGVGRDFIHADTRPDEHSWNY